MKKIISAILAVFMLVTVMSAVCSATTLTSGQIDSFRGMYTSSAPTSPITLTAEYSESANKVSVTYETEAFEGVTDPQVTIVAYLGETAPTAASSYEYIDQFDYAPDSTTGKGTFTFTPKSTIGDEYVITVMMGGTDVDIPATCEITNEEADFVKGDANGNNEVDMGDASAVARHMVGLETLGETAQKAADANGNSEVDMGDASAIARHMVGLETIQ